MSDEETSSFDEGSTDTGSTEESTDEETTDDNQGETSFRVQGENTFTVQASQGNQGQQIYNKPHDEEFGVEDDTAAGNQQQYQQQQQQQQQPQQQRQQYGADSSMVANQPHDEEFDVQDGDIPSPDKNNNGRGGGAPRPGGPTRQPGGSHGTMANDHHDEFEDVENDVTDDDEAHQTPPRGHQQQPQQQQNQNRPGGQRAPDALQTSQLQNMPHDEEFPVSGNSPTTTDNSSPNQSPQQQQRPQGGKVQPITNNPNVSGSTQQRPTVNSLPHNMQQQQRKQPQGSTDEDTDTDTDTDDDGDNVPTNMRGNMPLATSTTTAASGTQQQVKEYNPADYEHVNRKVSQEVRDLFSAITDYQPVTVECPAKLRPFIPDFIPSVGDIETFCKIPRPDGKPDNLGLAVVDEPSSNQSNPAVVKIGLAQTSKVRAPQTVVDSVENAHSSPQVIDKWINDIKELQYKKPLPTVSYSKPMPEIEQLIQVWPPEFEEILASDVQLPPPGIDLNMVDYVKLLCSILDIPTHGNIIESLHVLFCTYLEFRMNQHFQHA